MNISTLLFSICKLYLNQKAYYFRLILEVITKYDMMMFIYEHKNYNFVIITKCNGYMEL